MAEQNTEDTKSPAAPRRGARPFVGPAGASGQPSPLARTSPPLSRPPRAPFSPAMPATTRAPLGAAKSAAELAERSPSATSAGPSIVPTTVAPDGMITMASIAAPTPAVQPAADVSPTMSDAHDAMTAADFGLQGLGASPYDRFATFDAAWHDAAIEAPHTPTQSVAPLDPASLGSVSDAIELWDAGTVPEATPEPAPAASDDSLPSWLMDVAETGEMPDAVTFTTAAGQGADVLGEAESAPAVGAAGDAPEANSVDDAWAEVARMPSADAVMAAGHIETYMADPALPPVAEVPAVDQWPDQLLAEYAPYVQAPTPSTLAPPAFEAGSSATTALPANADAGADAATVADTPIAEAPVPEAPVPEAPVPGVAPLSAPMADEPALAEPDVPPPAPVVVTHEDRWSHEYLVSSALDRLAKRVRAGEIDVSFVAPGAPDAAVLASVLAALLGGGRSSH